MRQPRGVRVIIEVVQEGFSKLKLQNLHRSILNHVDYGMIGASNDLKAPTVKKVRFLNYAFMLDPRSKKKKKLCACFIFIPNFTILAMVIDEIPIIYRWVCPSNLPAHCGWMR